MSETAASQHEPYCFVIMSFSDVADTQATYVRGISPAIEGLGIRCVRVDETEFQGRITDEIVRLINGAYFVVADLSEERPNCYYEFGYAHAQGKPIIPVIRTGFRIHFDLHDLPFIVYDTPEKLFEKLRNRIRGTVLLSQGPQSDDDPHKGEFGRSAVDLAHGRLLTASISPAGEDEDHECDVHLEVRSLPGAPELQGTVTFYIHDDFDPDFFNIQAKNGVAKLWIEADGAFTVGAVADRRTTRLELDLAQVPGGTDDFYKT